MFPIQDSVPRRCPPLMMWAIMAVNIFFFLLETRLGPHGLQKLFYLYGVVPARYTHPEWASWVGLAPGAILPLFTAMFLHGSWLHIIGNMWTLWIFGDNIEDELGHFRFLVFYLCCGLVASIVQIITNAGSTIPVVGASGAIAGVMGAYYVLFPTARIIMMVPILFFPFFFEVPAIFFLALWFMQQLFGGALSLAGPKTVGGIAWWAHAGGFLFGILTIKMFRAGATGCGARFSDEYTPWGIDARWPQ